jgi:hypothetical protein
LKSTSSKRKKSSSLIRRSWRTPFANCKPLQFIPLWRIFKFIELRPHWRTQFLFVSDVYHQICRCQLIYRFVAAKFNCYKEIVWYLRDKNFVSKPELWRRLKAQQGPSRNGYKWEFAGGDQLIDSPVVHVVNMTNRRSENYIIALAYDQVSDVEVPVPLGSCHTF